MLIRRAKLTDLDRIVRLANAGGPDGAPREELPAVLPDSYTAVFAAIDRDPRAQLMVAEIGGEVVGTFQLNTLTYLAGKGRDDAQLESVHVAEDHRGQGIGAAMIQWAVAEAKRLGCRRLQLTTNKKRVDAQRFYRRLGFAQSHEGMKLEL